VCLSSAVAVSRDPSWTNRAPPCLNRASRYRVELHRTPRCRACWTPHRTPPRPSCCLVETARRASPSTESESVAAASSFDGHNIALGWSWPSPARRLGRSFCSAAPSCQHPTAMGATSWSSPVRHAWMELCSPARRPGRSSYSPTPSRSPPGRGSQCRACATPSHLRPARARVGAHTSPA
jgi:hypothetical protein